MTELINDLYPIAIQEGISPESFWVTSYEKILIQIEANKKRRLEALKEQAIMDYKRAQLISYSVNDPKKMPSIEKTYPFFNNEFEISPEEKFENQMKSEKEFMMMRATQIKKARELKKSQT